MSSKFDIIIVGGGMVGLTMAVALGESGMKILLVEKQNLDDLLAKNLLLGRDIKDEEFDVRVSAISPANRNFLKQLSVWQKIPLQRIANYQHMSVWDGEGTGNIKFSAAEVAQPNLGAIVENRVIQAALLEKLQYSSNITCQFDCQLKSVQVVENSVQIELNDNAVFKSQLLIGADGSHSKVRECVNIVSENSAYRQTAFVANVRTELDHQNIAWQRFIPSGPVAFLPLANNNLCSIVWTLDDKKAELVKQASRQDFSTLLQNAFESKLGKINTISQHFGFPLIKRHAVDYISDRVVLIGDAAHTIHPLAGQGVNLGFQDALCLSQLIHELKEQERDFGLRRNLRAYERERKTRNLAVQNAMSGFKHLFASQNMPLTLVRNFAMSTLNQIPSAKEIIIKKAMGY